ncbi:MAG: recombinase RecT [Acutalibacteraceae bacterium]
MINNTLKEPGRANRFIAAITSAVATTPALQTCDPSSILAGGLLGEALNLSPSPQLGQYYLVPFKQKAKYDREGHLLSPECSKAQFVLGYKGYVQPRAPERAVFRSDCMEIRQGEYLGKDPQTGKPQFKFIEDDDLREKLPIVGYMAYFRVSERLPQVHLLVARKDAQSRGYIFSGVQQGCL